MVVQFNFICSGKLKEVTKKKKPVTFPMKWFLSVSTHMNRNIK